MILSFGKQNLQNSIIIFGRNLLSFNCVRNGECAFKIRVIKLKSVIVFFLFLFGRYTGMQVQNIVNAVVPEQELLDAEMELAFAHFEHDGPLDAGRIPAEPLASGPPA